MIEEPESTNAGGIRFESLVKGKLVLLALPPEGVSLSAVLDAGAKDVLVLSPEGPDEPRRETNHVAQKSHRLSDVRKNNCEVAILHGKSALAVLDKRKFGRFSHLLIPNGIESFALRVGMIRYGRRNNLTYMGKTRIGGSSYQVIEVGYKPRDNRRQFGLTGFTPLELMRKLDGLDYVALRWAEDMEAGTHEGDIDLLVTQEALIGLKERFNQAIATYPLDVYTDDGQGGHAYKSVPYFTHTLAKALLESATTSPAGIRTGSPYWRFLAFSYHLMFHNKSEHVGPGNNEIMPDTFHKPHYHKELVRISGLAGKPVPKTFDEIERNLSAEGALPSLDLIGFYSNKNAFLKKRYFDRKPLKAGLSTFFVRDFGDAQTAVPRIREQLSAAFEIIHEGPLDDTNRERVTKGVRGGNWADPKAPNGIALPVHWFVCWDQSPTPPSARTRRKHARVDNENIRLKDKLRQDLVEGKSPLRIIHSSDNSLEAMDHLEQLGLSEDSIVLSKLNS
jgi:hypothetical protein